MAEASPGAMEMETGEFSKMEAPRSKSSSSKTKGKSLEIDSKPRNTAKNSHSNNGKNSKRKHPSSEKYMEQSTSRAKSVDSNSGQNVANGPSRSSENTDSRRTKHKEALARKQSSNAKIQYLTKKIAKVYTTAEKDRKSVCGKPTCKSMKLFVIVYALLFLVRGALRQYMFNILEHLQRQFTISANELEFIMGAEKIGFAITLIFAAYYGNNMCKPIAVFSGALVCAIATFVCMVPHILEYSRSGIRNESSTNLLTIPLYYDAGLCQVGRNYSTSVSQCDALNTHSNKTESFSVLSIGNFGIGVGSSFLITLGFTYIEENVEKNAAPLYYGIVLCLNGIGELLGQITAWQLTSYANDLSGRLALREWDVGAWWLGLSIEAALFIVLPFPLLFFPKWIIEPIWLITRRKRTVNQLNKTIQSEKKYIQHIKRKLLRELRKMKKDKRKKKEMAQRNGSFSGTRAEGSSLSLEDAAQVNPGFEASDNESDGTHVNGNGNGHLYDNQGDRTGENGYEMIQGNDDAAENGFVNAVLKTDNNSDENDSDDSAMDDEALNDEAIIEKDSESDAPQGSDFNIYSPDNSVDADVIVQDDRHVTFDTAGSKPSSSVQQGMDLDEILRSEEPPRNGSLDDTSSLKSDKSTSANKRRYQLGRRFQDLPKNLWFLINRPVYILLVVGSMFGAYSFTGYHHSLSLYMDRQFPNYDPPGYIIAGVPYCVGLILGTLISGILIHKRPPKVISHIKIIVILQAIVTGIFLLKLAVNCETKYFFDTPKLNNETFSMVGDCNSQCDCEGVQYEPVCSRGGIIFPSACHAGCRIVGLSDTHNSLLYEHCSCLVDLELSSSFCDSGCTGAIVGYAVLVFLSSLCQGLGLVSLLVIILRCIAEKLRSLALGFAVWLVFLGASVPGYTVYTAFLNLSCLTSRETYLEDDQCWHVDSSLYNYLQNGATAAFQFICFIFYLSALLVARHRSKTTSKVTDSNGGNNREDTQA